MLTDPGRAHSSVRSSPQISMSGITVSSKGHRRPQEMDPRRQRSQKVCEQRSSLGFHFTSNCVNLEAGACAQAIWVSRGKRPAHGKRKT